MMKEEAKIKHIVDLRGIYRRYVIPADKFDVRAMLDAYAKEAPHGFGGRNEDEAYSRLRDFVRRFAKEAAAL